MSSLLCGLPIAGIDSCFGSKSQEAQRKRVVTKTTTTTTVVHVNNSFNYGLSDGDDNRQYHPPVGGQNGSQSSKNIDTDNSGSERRNSLSSFQSESTVHIIESVKEQEETVEPSEELGRRNPLRWLTIPFKAFKARYQDESADKKKIKGKKDKLKFKEKRNNKGKKEVISRTIVVSKKNQTTGGGKDEIEEGSLPSIPPQVMKRHFQSGEDELLFLENQMPFIRKVASLKVMRSSTTTRSSYADSLSPTAKNGSIALHVLPMKTRSPTNHFGMNYKFSVPPSPRIHHQ